MTTPPAGTVTFLFTDVEGSTQLARRYPEEMRAALTRHHAILHETIDSHEGYLFRTIGDEFEVAFATAQAGLDAALAAQRGLHAVEWGETPIRVRMGLHTGQAVPRGDDYDGYLTLAHTKRLMSTAYGEQVLMSEATEALVQDQLPEGVTLRDLGSHRLKDFDRAEHIYQVYASDLRTDFPPLTSLDTHPNNLPAQLTSFIGREKELKELKELLRTTRLLTLTGPGGTGKTRLSLELATQVLKEYRDGAWLVELAPLADPSLIAQKVATTLGVREQPGRAVLDSLLDYVRAKNLLLILDNCEHLIDASAQLAETLLQNSPGLKIVASSRESLGIVGEKMFRVPSLNVPEEGKAKDLEALAQNDCVKLFVERASAAYPRFQLSEKNANAIAEICVRLDGIPLAVELAAARTKVLPPDQIAARLDDRFRLLTGGSRTALERHQTLFALIEWSYNLLTEPERVLLNRLSVFAGGWTFEAAQAVCSEGLAEDVLDLLTRLVDKSLVDVEEQAEGRYRMLETIRQYARDRLFESGESPTVRDKHLAFFVRLAEEAGPKLRGAEQLEWLERLDVDFDNLRVAMAWGLESGKGEQALELAGALHFYWALHGGMSEGRKLISEALAHSEREQTERVAEGETFAPSRTETAHRARALLALGYCQMSLMEIKPARESIEEALRLWRGLGDIWWIATTMDTLGIILVWWYGEYETATANLEEGVSLARQLDDPLPLAECLIRLGDCVKRKDLMIGRRYLEEGVALARRAGDRAISSDGLRILASIYYMTGEHSTSTRLSEEALTAAKELGSTIQIIFALVGLSTVACLRRDAETGRKYGREIWALAWDSGSPFGLAMGVLNSAFEQCFVGDARRGLRLFSASRKHLGQVGGPSSGAEGEPMDYVIKQALSSARERLDEDSFAKAMAEGEQLTFEQMVALATEGLEAQ